MRGRLCGGPTHAALWIARRPMGTDQGFSARPGRPCRRQCSGQPVVRRSRSLQVSNGNPLARPACAFRRLEDRAPALQSMGEERRFRADLQAVGKRPRQRIHDDRCHHRARSSAQRRRAKKNGPQAIGRSRGGLTTKIHALVDALGNPVELMLQPGQAHDLACSEPLNYTTDPDALIGDKAYDADSFVDTLAQRGITPVIPSKTNRKTPRACDFALYCYCLLYTSDAADDLPCVDLGGRRIIKK